MTDTVVNFPGVTRLDLPADQILESALGKLERAIVIGYTSDGEEYFASSIADGGEVVWLIERMKLQLLRVVEEDND